MTSNSDGAAMVDQSDIECTVISLEEVELPPEKTLYRIVEGGTTRGGSKLFDSLGYTYTIKNVTPARTTWRCSVQSKNRCNVTVKQVGQTFEQRLRHDHKPTSGQNELAEFKRMLEKATADQNEPAAKSLKQGTTNHEFQLLSKGSAIEFELDFENIPNEFLRADIYNYGARHIVFATDSQLHLLQHSRTWYMDSTINLAVKPFTQMLTINVMIRNIDSVKHVPVIVAFMTRQNVSDFEEVFSAILSTVGTDITPGKIILEYKQAMWKAVLNIFPSVKLSGCCCHFRHAVFNMAKTLGLTKTKNKETISLVDRLMAMCLLPPSLIKNTFNHMHLMLTYRNCKNEITELFKYFKETWINHNLWTVENVTLYGTEVRTNADMHGWYRRIKSSELYQLIADIHEECVKISISPDSTSPGNLSKKSAHTTLNAKISETWKHYEDGLIEPRELVTVLSRLF